MSAPQRGMITRRPVLSDTQCHSGHPGACMSHLRFEVATSFTPEVLLTSLEAGAILYNARSTAAVSAASYITVPALYGPELTSATSGRQENRACCPQHVPLCNAVTHPQLTMSRLSPVHDSIGPSPTCQCMTRGLPMAPPVHTGSRACVRHKSLSPLNAGRMWLVLRLS